MMTDTAAQRWMQTAALEEERESPRPGERELAGIETADGFRTYSRPPLKATLQRLENPLSSDGAYYLRAYLRQFPTAVDKQMLRDQRDQFLARLEGVA